MSKLWKLLFFIWMLSTSGCAIMHHTQVGEVDSKIVLKGERFEILVSETGINLKEAAEIGKALAKTEKTKDAISSVQEIISMFQMGPRTGNHVFSDSYADAIFGLLKRECPSMRVSGLTSIRESAKYPVVSGEIVKIIGYCKS